MNKSHAKRRRDIKNKLMAAICMLLVSSIMMVSTTYAWFTLSTAPEVTGITTAVGANGNLEMALLPKDGLTSSITSAAGDSVLDIEERNVTWGNLVDLSDTTIYGLDKITLFPSALNEVVKGQTIGAIMLKTPTYGADGRVNTVTPNTTTGYFDNQTQSFSPNDFYGVRAVGTASGMTDRELDYRNARSAANTAKAQAANQASQSLNNNGSSLANVAIKHGMGGESESYGKADVESLRAIVSDLNGKDGVLDRIETAYLQSILAYAASAAGGTTDGVWSAVKGEVSKADATLTSVTTALTSNGVELPAALSTAIEKYNTTVTNVNTADSKLQELEATLATNADATFTWAQISAAMSPLADTSAMTINGFKASEVKEKLGDLVSSVTDQGGLVVTMATGGGVYADIADQCGDYTASVTIDKVEYNGITLNNMKARMETKTEVKPVYLEAIAAAVSTAGAPARGDDEVLPITDMYGYVIDMAFRTNAADSKLLLQVDAADRIYDGNSNEDTMGHGSSMTFAASTPDFSNDQVKSLMKAIRIVFFVPGAESNTIVATAKLDVENATIGTDGVTAKMYLYTLTAGGTTYTEATAEQLADKEVPLYTKGDDDQYTAYTRPAEGTELPAGTYYVATTTTGGEQKIEDNAIMALTQNTAHALSMLVYLDGEAVGNDDVAATASTSMTGKMSLQFASSANLVPMEYADLHIPGASTETTGTSTETTGTSTETTGTSTETSGDGT